MDGAFVEFRHVHAAYKEPKGIGALLGKAQPPSIALGDISFSLKRGEHVTVFGLSGAGKSTLLALLSGTLLPDSGSVLIDGKPATLHPNAAHGFVSLEHDEPKGSTVYEALHAFGTTHDIGSLPSKIGEIAQLT